ncbi:MAG: lipopolysaccharide heptosyltransferase II [Planctomycetota bacterium]
MREPLASISAANVLIHVPNWVGDAVMATPALLAIRTRFADARITLLGREIALDVLEGAGLADDTIDSAVAGKGAGRITRLASILRERRFDLAILLPGSFRSAMVMWLAKVPRRVGYRRDGRGRLLTDRLAVPRKGGRRAVYPAVDYYADLAEALGATVDDRQMRLGVTDGGEARAEKTLAAVNFDPSRPLVMFNPGGSYGPSKLWPAERYAAVADSLMHNRSAQIIINAAPGEGPIAQAVQTAMHEAPLINLAHYVNSLSLLKSLLARTDVLVTNDTGARHIGAAMGCGVVTLFGSTDPNWTIINYSRERIIQADVPCAPCQKKTCPNPLGKTYHQCMQEIDPAEVLTAVESLLGGRPGNDTPMQATQGGDA